MIAGAYPVLNYIPVASLSGIMFVVVIHTFKWSPAKLPRPDQTDAGWVLE